MSVFSVGGNAGFAIGPLFVTAVLAATGTRGTPLLAAPALVTGIAVYAVLRYDGLPAYRPPARLETQAGKGTCHEHAHNPGDRGYRQCRPPARRWPAGRRRPGLALTRDPAGADFPPGVAVTGGDYAAPGTMTQAVRGADAVFVNIGGFATNTLTWAASVRAEGVVRFPYGEAALAPIAEQDIAAAATRVLLDPGHASQTYVLTGAESLTQLRQAELIGEAKDG
jgi:hypothetical protein